MVSDGSCTTTGIAFHPKHLHRISQNPEVNLDHNASNLSITFTGFYRRNLCQLHNTYMFVFQAHLLGQYLVVLLHCYCAVCQQSDRPCVLFLFFLIKKK